MHLATVRAADGRTHAAREQGAELTLLPWADVNALLQQADWPELAPGEGNTVSPETVAYHTLVPHPNKIICLGLNYSTHITEMGRPIPDYPTLFAKFEGALIGARDPITLPHLSDQVDWEAELGAVIGAATRHVAPAKALDAAAGYTVINDVTARDWQHRTREFLSGKTFEATTLVGPVLVTPEELPQAASGLDITCAVGRAEMQRSTTADLLFGVADIVAYIRTIITLPPGNLIATGTRGGVGAGRTPKVFPEPGPQLVTRIERIGELRNTCVPEQPPGDPP
ncbi:MAG: acylpyruvate hydrolase [Trebonia sp.]|jgi:acylpyruvate hydrolase|nr:acylpyruvate hydrolase [Trebonia sp.]